MNDKESTHEEWAAYLKEQQSKARRQALREAILADGESAEKEVSEYVDGKGTIQIVFVPPNDEEKFQSGVDEDQGVAT